MHPREYKTNEAILPWDFVHFRKILVGFCAYLEVSPVILGIFGSFSWDCVYLRVPRGIDEELPKCTQSHEELSNMHNPMRNFQKCTKSNEKLKNSKKSHEELPKMHKIP
jgi:hypothetical protein